MRVPGSRSEGGCLPCLGERTAHHGAGQGPEQLPARPDSERSPPGPRRSPGPFIYSPGPKDVSGLLTGKRGRPAPASPSPAPPGPSSDLSGPVYGPLGFFQPPDMNLRGPTGSSAPVGHKPCLGLSCVVVYVMSGWEARAGGATAPSQSRVLVFWVFFFFAPKGERKALGAVFPSLRRANSFPSRQYPCTSP